MSESTPDKPAIYDVLLDLGNGTHLRIERGLSRVAAQRASQRISKFFLGVRVVERAQAVGARGRRRDNTFG